MDHHHTRGCFGSDRMAASFGFSVYVNNVGNYSAIYGSLGAVIVLLMYLYISGFIVLFGAEVNEQIYNLSADGQKGDEELQETGSSNG
jgi:membrane protein